ncbi:hypothetical protein MASR2M64_00630 [Candidatus Cloacimonadota bacterium]
MKQVQALCMQLSSLLLFSYHCPIIALIMGIEWAMIGQCQQGDPSVNIRINEDIS